MLTDRPCYAEVLVVPGCPNAELTVARLRDALASTGCEWREIAVRVVEPDSPVPVGFAGSPTVLLDGVDPFTTSAVAALRGSLPGLSGRCC